MGSIVGALSPLGNEENLCGGRSTTSQVLDGLDFFISIKGLKH